MVLYGGSEKPSFQKENPFPTCSTDLLGQTCRYAFDHGPDQVTELPQILHPISPAPGLSVQAVTVTAEAFCVTPVSSTLQVPESINRAFSCEGANCRLG